MMPKEEFDHFDPGDDPYREATAHIILDDLLRRDDDLPIKLSVLTSTYHRYSQLRRSLECLARQNWREFEVLICDDGDDYDLTPIFQEFEPFLRLKTIRRERTQFHVDPTGGFRELLPLASGEYIALMQPEVMLHPDACWSLYDGHFHGFPDETRYWLSGSGNPNTESWVALKVTFMSPSMQRVIDSVDWHSEFWNIGLIPQFATYRCGLSGQSNSFWFGAKEFPWWFVGSAKREARIFWDMPEFLGHASIDFYLITYRQRHDYVDIVPFRPLGCHQDHHRIAIGFEGEQEDIGKKVQETMK